MRDISRKIETLRAAVAEARLIVSPETIARLRKGEIPKGDPLETAKVAAIQAAKNTARIIPYCHDVPLAWVGVEFDVGEGSITTRVTARAINRTGVEMEALTGASVAALTLYDMMKMLDDAMRIEAVTLLEKVGGKSDFGDSHGTPLRAAVLVLSDSVSAGRKRDEGGRMIVARLEEHGLEVADYRIIPDERERIAAQLVRYADKDRLDLVVTTGGTGFSPRDTTPEATADVLDREIPGIAEAARAYGQQRTPYSMLSRGRCGLRGDTLIINLPGSRKGVAESLDALFPAVLHAFKMIRGGGHSERTDRPSDGS